MICEVCHEEFQKVALSQILCTNCLISPKRNRINDVMLPNTDDITPEPTESELEMEKICTECHLPYQATSPRQLVCPTCKGVTTCTPPPVPPDRLTITPAHVEIVSGPAAPTIETMCNELLRISGCAKLTLNYSDLIVQITKELK